MEDEYSAIRRWEDMDIDILVKIFQRMNIYELISGVAHSNFIKIPLEPYVYVDGRSDKTFTRVLKIALNLSHESILTMIFHFNMYVSDNQLTYTAKRSFDSHYIRFGDLHCGCPRLKRRVMPAWNRIKKTGICQAVKMWGDLGSPTMPSISNPPYLMEEISRSCKNFAQLKVMGPCDINFASTLAQYLPNLKVPSLRCSVLFKDALIIILESMPGLEVLNISHCLLMEVPPQPAPRRVLKALDKSILERASKLKKFVTCMNESCTMCQRTRG
ncbi:hypothetical protein SASPL_107566 [Salvia splendens]|uniref:Uncharacterized protein n=1 Tax=Salvia splendens TaxID=180675 RepID=A0A8X8YD53_SALSN|nr:hypothetical protein SASPL_107566 [Salvia splendens]